MSIKLDEFQSRLGLESPGCVVRGAFLVDTRAPDHRGIGQFAGGGSELDLVLLPILALVVAIRGIRRRRQHPEGFRHLLVVTDRGVAIAQSAPWWKRRSMSGWTLGPLDTVRYELDPREVAKAASDVRLTLGHHTFWASGADRDAAFRLYGLQQP